MDSTTIYQFNSLMPTSFFIVRFRVQSEVAHWTDCRSGSCLNLCHLAWSKPILASVFTFSQSPCLCKLTFRFLSCAQTNFFQMSHSLLQSDGYDFRWFLTTQLAVVGLKGFSVSIWKFVLYVWRQQPLPLLRYSLFLEMKTVSFSNCFCWSWVDLSAFAWAFSVQFKLIGFFCCW